LCEYGAVTVGGYARGHSLNNSPIVPIAPSRGVWCRISPMEWSCRGLFCVEVGSRDYEGATEGMAAGEHEADAAGVTDDFGSGIASGEWLSTESMQIRF